MLEGSALDDHWLDLGADMYAATSWNSIPDGRRILTGWMRFVHCTHNLDGFLLFIHRLDEVCIGYILISWLRCVLDRMDMVCTLYS